MVKKYRKSSVETKQMKYVELKAKLHRVLQRPLFTATLVGLLPFGTKNIFLRQLNKPYFVLNASLLLIATCQLCNDLFDDSPKDVNQIIDVILNAGVYFSGFVLMILYGIKVKALDELIQYAYTHVRFHSQFSDGDHINIELILDRLNVGLPILLACTYASSYQWLVLPIFSSGPDGRRLLPIETKYPYPAYVSPYYEITYALQAYLFTILAFVYSNISATYTAMTFLVCTQFDILCCNIRNSGNMHHYMENPLIPTYVNLTHEQSILGGIKNAKNSVGKSNTGYKYSEDVASIESERKAQLAIADCIQMHQIAREFCKKVESYFNLPLSFQFLMIIVTMGCAVISFLQKFAMNTLQFTAISVFFLAICCFQGQQILHKSGLVHEAVWLSDWWRQGMRVRKAYVIMMQQGQFPSGISVGYGLFQLNLANLIAILRASFSFFTLLDNMIN